MSDVSLARLRLLRDRAKVLLENVQDDLSPFVQSDGTFRRKPDSPSGDVNVTTTCSCLMALALTNSFHSFYNSRTFLNDDVGERGNAIFQRVVRAPWMSSGLTANNAFTTTLVLRTFGFLQQEHLLDTASPKATSTQSKAWELHLGIENAFQLANELRKRADPASEFLWLSLSDKTRDLLATISTDPHLPDSPARENKLRDALALDLRRIVQSGWIYDDKRFDKASKATKSRLAQRPTGYALAEVNHLVLIDQYPAAIATQVPRSLQDIAALMAPSADNFSINEYPSSATVLYWFVDGIARAEITLSADGWRELCTWAAREFNHERSLVVAEHDAMMDPIAMGMSACLCARLRAISDEAALGTTKDHLSMLPSIVELERSIDELISKQTKSGIWPKYFPIFHYQDAGSNFCFTFELLEAVLYEFGGRANKLLGAATFVEGMEKAVTWCENNRLKYSAASTKYTGWNSGGYLDTLKKGQPESWATAVVHMFLWELDTVISRRIQQEILRKYKTRPIEQRPSATTANVKPAESPALDKLLEIEVLLQGTSTTLSSVLRTQIIENYATEREATLRRNPTKKPLSALLFGPPGTSKTQITKAVAADLNWPLLELTPADFVRGTLANVYLQADEIFDDLMDLSGVVVFFDEMDALVQTREGDTHLDIASQFLTTTMLPKLTRLHDQARVVFFMATNFQDRFDAAIKRAGRFDLLLCMGPPKLADKLERLHTVYLTRKSDQTIKAGQLIKQYLKRVADLREELELYTFGEFQAFLKTVGDKDSIGDKVETLGASQFRKRLRDNSKFVTLKPSDLAPLRKIGVRWKRLADLDKKTFTLKQLEKKKLQPTQIIRYYCDRRESKLQQ